MKQYYLLCIPGSCGMFVASLMSHYLLGVCETTISANGHCHDLGQGTWQNTSGVYLIGDQWQDRVYHKPILFSHYADVDRVREFMPHIQIVLIDFDTDDIELISRLRTAKAHHLNWTLQEYLKLAGPNWPPYHPDNILQDRIILDELTRLQIPHTADWLSQIDRKKANYVLKFKDIIRGNINKQVAEIFGRAPDPELEPFVKEYQQVNRERYE